jgi:hypothetical protein
MVIKLEFESLRRCRQWGFHCLAWPDGVTSLEFVAEDACPRGCYAREHLLIMSPWLVAELLGL